MTDEVTLYEQSDFPVFQNRMYETLEEARQCPTGDIRLVQNTKSGLLYNSAFQSDLMVYDQSYQNEQAHSASFVNHLNAVADLIEDLLGRRDLVEIGCGKAAFLEILQARGCAVEGFDPTYQGTNPYVRQEKFSLESSLTANGLILRHVLEHVSDPVDFLCQIKDANHGGGLIYIEVPCFDWIIKQRAWFDIFYEHVNYFRLPDFDRIFGNIVASGRLFGGQCLYVVADLKSLRVPSEEVGKVQFVQFPPDFGPNFKSDLGLPGRSPSTVWGAASKGVIYSLLRERAGDPVQVLIDINPGKQGRFVPGTGLKVVSPMDGLALLDTGSTICVMNPNYSDEIRKIVGSQFNLIGVMGEQL